MIKAKLITKLFNYGRLSRLEREIIEHLYETPCKGGYSVLTFELGRPKSHCSNVRKAVNHLRDLDILWVHIDKSIRAYSYIELAEDWCDSLYYAFDVDGVCRVQQNDVES